MKHYKLIAVFSLLCVCISVNASEISKADTQSELAQMMQLTLLNTENKILQTVKDDLSIQISLRSPANRSQPRLAKLSVVSQSIDEDSE